jgi:hypothetical protein
LTLCYLQISSLIELTGCKASVDVVQCNNITSGKGLENCEEVILTELRELCDVGMLGAVPRVSITFCPKVLELWRSEPDQCVELNDMAQVENLDLLALAANIQIDWTRVLPQAGARPSALAGALAGAPC